MNQKIYYVLAVLLMFLVAGIWGIKEINEQKNQSADLVDWQTDLGQMFMLGFYGQEPPPAFMELIKQGKIGGVILLKYNLGTAEQIKNLIAKLQAAAPAGRPLLIAIDQEGGPVSRLPAALADATPQTEITDATTAYAVGRRRGEDLTSLGFNTVFSPVLDYITSAQSFLFDRAFHGSQTQIADWGKAMIRGYADGGVIASAKHFPGFSDDSIDAHNDLPNLTLKQPFDEYAAQFKSIVQQNPPPMIMSTHLVLSGVSKWPAGMSSEIINQKLRDDWHYQGVIISDDMEMGALAKNYSIAEAAVQAVNAGNNILLYVSTLAKYQEAYEAVAQAVVAGEIAESRITDSGAKIRQLKRKALSTD